MPDEVKVVTQDLRTKAAEIKNIQFSNPMNNVPVIPPDGLKLSKAAVDNLNQNASFLYRNQDYGDREGDRLAETLQSVAEAYDLADASAAASIDGKGAPQTPKTNAIPAPAMPAPMGSPLGITADEIGDVEMAQQTLSAGDHGASLREAAAQWMANGNALEASSQLFKEKPPNWEGDAADQAHAKSVAYGEWLSQLGESWQKLAGEAMRISDAHVKALLTHTPVYQNYEQLKAQMIAAIANGGSAAHTLGLEMEKLQRASEEIVDDYAKEAAPQRVTPPNPPQTGVPTVPVTSNGQPGRSGPAASPAAGGSGGGAGGGSGQSPSAPQTPTPNASAMSAEKPTGGTPSGEGAGSGGGSPSGGGAPAGGSPGGGMPSLPGGGAGDVPPLPDEPGLHPAAADAGGGAGGS
ncbi:ESX-1 secretion-associated protein, partial [Mycolicibacterium sp.]|uniref:PPE domain-containing protein n=1 Tax=Mycolicibacterium sp. TaxID=2320850 RepID=UPI001A1DB31C